MMTAMGILRFFVMLQLVKRVADFCAFPRR
jgi:hypothetical protein